MPLTFDRLKELTGGEAIAAGHSAVTLKLTVHS